MEVLVKTIKFDGKDVDVPVMTNSVAVKKGDISSSQSTNIKRFTRLPKS